MFIDFYLLLEIEPIASLDEIKSAFRKQAIRWHPDRNPEKDTTGKMQSINEAYLILKDAEARSKYDIEYFKFLQFKKQKEYKQEGKAEEPKYEYSDYEFSDEILKKWMDNARKQAVSLAKETIKEFANIASIGVKETAKGMGRGLVLQMSIGVIFLLIFALKGGCN